MDTLRVRAMFSLGSRTYLRCLFVKCCYWHAALTAILILVQGITFSVEATAQINPPGLDSPTTPSATLEFVNDGYFDAVYDTWDGQLFFEYERKASSLSFESRSAVFTGKCLGLGQGFFDICSPKGVAKLSFGDGFSVSDVVAYAQLGLDWEYLTSDLFVPPTATSTAGAAVISFLARRRLSRGQECGGPGEALFAELLGLEELGHSSEQHNETKELLR